ncbi:putative ribonuclease H-like domain-containing protein [Tanacetum coccineum]
MSIDDMYNNFKIVKQSVKKSVGASSGAQSLAFMTAPSTSSTNDVNTAKPAYEVSTVSPNVNTASPQVSTASFSDNAVYAFMVENPNGSNLLQQDLEQIHEDDLEAMDLKWQLSLLSIRAKRYFQRTCKKIFINANDTAGYDKSKVECFNCHKMRHFARECRTPRNKEGQFRNQDNTRKHGNNKDTSSKAMLAIDGVGFDWSDMVEEQLITYRKNEVLFSEEVAVLKREVACKGYEINVLKSEFEKVKQEKEGIEFKIEKFDNASKSLNKLLENDSKENSDDSLVKEQVSKDTSSFVESPLNVDKETVFLVDKKIEFVKPKNHEKPVKKSVRYAEMYRSQSPRGNQRNWNGQKSNQLGSDFVMYNKACFICGSFDHVQINCNHHQRKRIVSRNNYNRVDYDYYAKTTHPTIYRNMTPRVVLLKTGLTHFNTVRPVNTAHPKPAGKPQQDDTGFVDSGCSRHMTGNIAYLSDFKEFDGDMLHLGEEHMVLPDEIQILLKIPRKDNMYNFDMKNININKLVKDNLVRGLPTKHFENDQTCVAYLKGKQHRASCKSKVLNPITKPLFMLHMDLFGPTFMSSLMHKKYCLVVTGDYNRFTWVFFLTTKDETSEILKNFIKEIENLVDKKVKIIRCDNGTEFKNKVMDDFCREKGIRREYSVARTPQQNGVAERRNRTLIKAARTMLADLAYLPQFWRCKVVSTACYVQNRVLVVKPHNKTPYELFRGLKPALNFMRPFGCHVTILNTLDNLGKFDGKSDEGFFVGYSLSSKAFRVYNTRTRRVEENLHIGFLENKPMIEGNGPKWLFDIDSLTQSMNYVPIAAGTITNESAGTQEELNAGTSTQKEEISQDCIVMPIWKDASYFDSPSKDVGNGELKYATDDQKQVQGGPYIKNDEKDKSDDDSSHNDEDEPEIKPTSIAKALSDSSWVEAMQEELLQFKLQQSAFLYGTIEEEVYVTQPLGFKDPNNPDKVYKVVKALYGLHQAPRAWYETLANYLLGNRFKIGKIDQTLFIKKQKGDILLVQVAQKEDGIFISHDKYVAKILKKFNYTDVKYASSPVDLEKPLVKDGDADDVDISSYTKDITSLSFAYTDSDYAGVTQDRKSTTGGCQFLGNRLISWQYLLTKGFEAGRFQYLVSSKSKEVGTPRYLSLVVLLKKVGDEAVHKELDDRMERATTTASSLEVEQDSGSGPRCQDTILGDVDAQTRFETTSKQSNDPPLLRVNTLGSGEDSMKLLELMELCTKLSNMLHKNRKSDLVNQKK